MTRLPGITALLLLAAGCSGQPPVPEDHYYRLGQPAPAAEARLTEGAIFVERFSADGVHVERSLTYVEGAGTELKQHHYHHWIDSPARLLRDHLIDYLRAGDAADMVTDSATEAAEISIYGKIRQLDIVRGRGAPQVSVALEFRVERRAGDSPPLIRAYQVQREADDHSINGAVKAFGVALDEIYSQLVDDLEL